MARVKLEQFCKQQSCREFNSLQDGAIFETISKVLCRRLLAGLGSSDS